MIETGTSSEQDLSLLNLGSLRQILPRIEGTLLFAFAERARFAHNRIIYRQGAFPDLDPELSLCGHLLRETERTHARMGRYTCPDENPFNKELPGPRCRHGGSGHNPLVPNRVNINDRILDDYVQLIVPLLCRSGDDLQYGSSAFCDILVLQTVSRRIHYGKFVAESKYRSDPEKFNRLIADGARKALEQAITHAEVEQAVIERVRNRATVCLGELNGPDNPLLPDPETLAGIYRDWIIPLNKTVQVEYLAQRGVDEGHGSAAP